MIWLGMLGLHNNPGVVIETSLIYNKSVCQLYCLSISLEYPQMYQSNFCLQHYRYIKSELIFLVETHLPKLSQPPVANLGKYKDISSTACNREYCKKKWNVMICHCNCYQDNQIARICHNKEAIMYQLCV